MEGQHRMQLPVRVSLLILKGGSIRSPFCYDSIVHHHRTHDRSIHSIL